MFRAFAKEASPKPASKQKPIKQYGRKRSFLHLHNKNDIFSTVEEVEESEPMDLDEVPTEPEIPKAEAQIANTKAKRRGSKLRVRVQSMQEKAEAKAIREREDKLMKRRAEDEAIAENERAEKEYEQERTRLYQELEEVQKMGWVEHEDHDFTSSYLLARSSRRERQDENQQSKRCKRDVQDLEDAIVRLRKDRERVWFDFYNSIEGLTFNEKKEMKAIRATKRDKEDTRAMKAIRGDRRDSPDFDTRTGRTSLDYGALFGRRKGEDCMYCGGDGCRGC